MPFGSHLAKLAFCAYLVALRAPSEALQLMRSSPSDSLGSQQPANDEGLISVRQETPGDQLALRLAYRKNLPA